MKIRNIFYSLVALVALSATFAFKSAKRVPLTANIIYVSSNGHPPQCLEDFGETDQSNCSPLQTGAFCTVTEAPLAPHTAYLTWMGTTCVYPLRQP